MAPGPSQLRADQLALLRWTLAGLAGLDSPEVGRFDPLGPAPALPLDRFAAAGLATGLTAALAALAGDRLPSGWAARANEQRAEVAARQRRFAELTPRVLWALHDAGVDAVPVKGAVLAGEVWPAPEARPMADIDVVIPPGQRAAAGAALSAAGLRPAGTNPWEDTFLAWGDGAVGRTDGESADHNGKVELHPGWVERLHNYLVGDRDRVIGEAAPGELAGAPCRRLPPGALAAQVVGHLSASVVRAEVRALNVVDAVLALRGLEPAERRRFDALVGGLDARLAGPGLWLVGALAPAAAP
ncbi:MAG: nucleotidyltransferase family protein, partial [Acidimicrobiales bacterium]